MFVTFVVLLIKNELIMDLTTKYLGKTLRNPIIVGSCSLTSTIDSIKKLYQAGVGAIVLQSLFEDQIDLEDLQLQCANKQKFPDSSSYIKNYVNDNSVNNYLQLIKDAKKETSIPIFASLNCHPDDNWIEHAKKMENAGVDGIELNVLMLPCNFEKSGEENEKLYFEVTEKARKELNIPIALKLSSYSAGLSKLVNELSWTKNMDSFVLFNRFYKPDIDIDTLEIKIKNTLSSPSDITDSLRWTLLLSRRVKMDIVGTTGIHSGRDIIKHLLAGSQAVQIVSALYKTDFSVVEDMLTEIVQWMDSKKFKTVKEYRGLLQGNKIEKNKMEQGHVY